MITLWTEQVRILQKQLAKIKKMWKNKRKMSQNPKDVKKVETINCQTPQKTQGRTKKYSTWHPGGHWREQFNWKCESRSQDIEAGRQARGEKGKGERHHYMKTLKKTLLNFKLMMGAGQRNATEVEVAC